MSSYDYPDAATTIAQPITEAQLAAQLERDGEHVRFAHGRWWREARSGFFEAAHWLARMREDEARRPGLCWGFRTTLHDSAAAFANARLPLHLVADLPGYDEACLPTSARRDLRRLGRRGVRIVRLTDMRLLEDQGYGVYVDWYARVGRPGPPPPREQFLQEAAQHLADPGWVVSAAMDGDRMLGYQTALAVDDTAYLHEIRVATSELHRGVTVALDHEAIELFKQSGLITRVAVGLHEPERPGLTTFKLRHCFPVVQVPARVWMLPPADLLLRSRRPLAYYRLTGRDPRRIADDGGPPFGTNPTDPASASGPASES